MLGKPFNILLLHQLNPQKDSSRTWLESRLKRNYYPAEILTGLDMLTAGLIAWANRAGGDAPVAFYKLLRKAVLDQESLEAQELQRIYDQYVKFYGHKPPLEEFAQSVLPRLSRLDQISLLVGLRPMGLSDTDENRTGLLFRAAGLTPQYSIFDFIESSGASHGNLGRENQALSGKGQR